MNTSNTSQAIELKREYPHDPQTLFDAFAKPQALEQWIAPSDAIATKVLTQEFIEGGKYRIQFTLPDGNHLFLKGEYVRITPPTQLCFTWEWEAPDVHAGIRSLVTVDITPKGDVTQLRIIHENLNNVEATTRHAQGWAGTLARLDNFLTKDTL